MDLTILIFLSSGLFLGWSLGANDAANVFGTAVGTRMVKFSTAALFCSVFVILGATIDGTGAAYTLGKLGSVNAIGGSFMAAFAAALTVYWMTKLGLPVSTSQAVVGAIIGWNLYSGSVTDMNSLAKIMGTWVACPLLSALIAIPIFAITRFMLNKSHIHLIRLDAYTRAALIFAGAFGSYALGANNIANVMGVFVSVSPFTDFAVGDMFSVTGIQQLFLLGAVAIAVGVVTYSKKVMLTVGDGLMALTPVAAWVVVISHSIVLFLFASEGLEYWLASHGLPTIPLVPVSSSQAVVGAVIGIGLLKGGKNIRWRVLGRISSGWVTTPIISAAICFTALFFLQNVFKQPVFRPIRFEVTKTVQQEIAKHEIPVNKLSKLAGKRFKSAVSFKNALESRTSLDDKQISKVLYYGEISDIRLVETDIAKLDKKWLSSGQIQALEKISGQCFRYKWQFQEAISSQSEEWKLLPESKLTKLKNKAIKQRINYLMRTFSGRCSK